MKVVAVCQKSSDTDGICQEDPHTRHFCIAAAANGSAMQALDLPDARSVPGTEESTNSGAVHVFTGDVAASPCVDATSD